MRVTMIRHTSVAVPKGTCYGWSDVPVADTFEQEAAVTRAKLEGMVFDQVYSSPLTRATKLAAYCGFPSPVLDDRLKEMNMGDWEMLRYDEIRDEALQRWYDDYMHLPAFLDELRAKPFRRVAIFAHGGVLVSAGIYAGLFGEENAFSHSVPYGGIQEIRL